jgi:hypothetical protein
LFYSKDYTWVISKVLHTALARPIGWCNHSDFRDSCEPGFSKKILCAYWQATLSLFCKTEPWNGRRNWLGSDLAHWPAIIH